MKNGLRLLAVFSGLFFFACQLNQSDLPFGESQSGAGIAMDHWAAIRSYPNGKIFSSKYYQAWEEKASLSHTRDGEELGSEWVALGPKNFGGRTLCMGFHPTNSDILFVGSASGGLWKSTTAGQGVNAWSYVSTGFPVLGVASIAINPVNPDEMYIGTGEVYNYNAAKPGVVDRFTRGSYGIGILKTTDGGITWEKSLDWSLEEMTGIQDLLINPLRPETVYAATTRGLFRSYNAGATWDNIKDIDMAVDIEMHPSDTSILLVSFGNLNSPEQGVYRSNNAGQSFSLLNNGIPSNYTGKTLLSYSQSDPNIIYASVANSIGGLGMFKSVDGGDSWVIANTEDMPTYQGWYSHDVAVSPLDPDYFVWGGVNGAVSQDGGQNLLMVCFWYLWDLGQTPVGGPEGPPNYVHADIHGLYFHPLNPEVVYAVTDGGIFYSGDQGMNWEGRNGGYQTQQFYADFGNSLQDSAFAIGGLQDNASAMYVGDDAWVRVLGGDGMTGAVHAENDSIVLGSYYYLNMSRSLNKGGNFDGLNVSSATNENKPFNAPFGFDPGVPDRIYGAAERLHRSDDLGSTWEATSSDLIDPGNMILTIGLTALDQNIIYVSTAPGATNPKVLKSIDGGSSWVPMPGLPDRVCSDIVIDPYDENLVYLTFSGFGTSHLYKTNNGGLDWVQSGSGLPDVPANTLFIDPLNPEILYFGNDLGVYVSFDAGATWEPFCIGLPDAVMAMNLSYSPSNRKVRLASHGNGVYEAAMLDFPVNVGEASLHSGNTEALLYPNPARDQLFLRMDLGQPQKARGTIFTATGKAVRANLVFDFQKGRMDVSIPISGLQSGYYVLHLEMEDGQVENLPFMIQ
ncbi:MAG: T9SS type A sorting domain-containing protein [Saprospiraceae bacterium]|nr:T9SS type A sorting domain-containing protein [Saprospiraceae bacterium]